MAWQDEFNEHLDRAAELPHVGDHLTRALRLYRDATGTDLAAALRYVEDVRHGRLPRPARPDSGGAPCPF